MVRSRQIAIALAVLSSLGLACRQLPPEERLEKIRSSYTATLKHFSLRQQPTEAVESEDETQSADASAATGEPDAAVAVMAVKSDLVLDVLIGTDSHETVSGLTLDFELVDSELQLKEQRQLYVDVSQVAKGSSIQLALVVEDVDYVEGDQLTVLVRSPVPPDERGSYREFADLPAS